MGMHEPHPADRPARILVVEDHAATAEMLRMILEDEGYDVTCVGTGDAALRLFSPHAAAREERPSPDVMVLDLTLPDMNAVEIVEQLHEHRPQEVPPVVLISAKQYPTVRVAADKIGAAAVVGKPFALEALLDGIKVALAQG